MRIGILQQVKQPKVMVAIDIYKKVTNKMVKWFNFYVDDDVHQDFKTDCARKGITMDKMLRKLVEEEVKKNGK